MAGELDIIRVLRTAPPLPAVAFRVTELVRRVDFEIADLVGLVRTDPSLTARVLRLVNSSLFGIARDITSVAEAITFVGTRNLVRLVLVSCAANQFRDCRSSIYGPPEALWRHSCAMAMASQWLAGHVGYPGGATAFTAGILHNVGKVVLAQTLDEPTSVGHASAGDLVARERALFGIDHAAAAGVIAATWALPDDIADALRSHHGDAAAADGPLLTAILAAAEEVVRAAGVEDGSATPAPGLAPALRTRLRLAEPELVRATADVTAELQRSAELLNLRDVSRR